MNKIINDMIFEIRKSLVQTQQYLLEIEGQLKREEEFVKTTK